MRRRSSRRSASARRSSSGTRWAAPTRCASRSTGPTCFAVWCWRGLCRLRDKPELLEFYRSAIEPLRDPIDPGFAPEWQQSTLAQPVPPAFFDMVVRECLQAPALVWRDAFAALFDDDFAAEIDRIAVPTLVVWGDRDAMCPPGDQERHRPRDQGLASAHLRGRGACAALGRARTLCHDLASFANTLASPAFSKETLQ